MSEQIVQRCNALIFEYRGRNLNEADTRHKLIDFVLHDVLAWPKNRVSLEEHISPGYADYILRKGDDDPIIVVEAKKEGVYFELPHAFKPGELSAYISLSKLLSDKNISDAARQARRYCQDIGCEFACITNGREWIFFKTFERGKRWESLNAFVAREMSFFSTEYTKAYNTLSYNAITSKLSLPALLTSGAQKDRNIYYAKDRIPSYSHAITANKLAKTLRPIVNHYFGVIGDNDVEFMDRCYVSHRDYHHSFDGMRTLIEDSLTPYFADYGVQQLDDTGKGGGGWAGG